MSTTLHGGDWTVQDCARYLSGLPEKERAVRVQHLRLGVAGGLLKHHGIGTLDALLPYLRTGFKSIPRFGPARVRQVTGAVWRYALARSKGGTAVTGETAVPVEDWREQTFYQARHRGRMAAVTLALPLCQLHFSLELAPLARLGVENAGQLFKLLEAGIPLGAGMAKARIQRIHRLAACLDGAIDDNGGVDWPQFAALAGFPIHPAADFEPANGREFLNGWIAALESLASRHLDETERLILASRFPSPQTARSSQKQLAAQLGITVQRIGQKERELLRKLAGALMEEDFGGLDFRFSAGLCRRWRRVAPLLAAMEDRRYAKVSAVVAAAWSVGAEELAPLLPLIFAIATGDSDLPADFFPAISFPLPLAGLVKVEDAAAPLGLLHPSPALALLLRKLEIRTVGDFIRSAGSHALPSGLGQLKEIQALLVTLAAAITPAGAIDWNHFLELRNISLLPAEEPQSAEQFVAQVIPVLLSMIGEMRLGPLAEKLFSLRIVPALDERMELAEVSRRLREPVSKIAKLQNRLAEDLFDLIFHSDYGNAAVHLRDGFTGYWHDAYRMSRAVLRPDEFTETLAAEWMIPVEELAATAPVLRAILRARPPRKLPPHVRRLAQKG